MDVMCAAIKKDGKPCQYRGKHMDTKTKKHYCGHHWKNPLMAGVAATKPIVLIRDVEPVQTKVLSPAWTVRGLPEPELKLLKRSVIQRLERKISSGPKPSDCTGHLYVYYLAGEEGRNYWKIGMTTRPVAERKKEWQAKHPGHVLVMKKSYEITSKTVKCLERVVHLYLNHRRMYRYPVGAKLLVSQWAATGAQIEDDDWKVWTALCSKEGKLPKLRATGKMVEWFCLPWETGLEPLLTALVKYYCGLALPALR